MRGGEKDAIQIAIKRKDFIEQAYRLFCKKNITSVALQEIADATPYGIATLYRYFTNKPSLVVEVATVKWNEYLEATQARKKALHADTMTAAQLYTFFLDSFIELYRSNIEMLRFNQFFNVYVQAEHIDLNVMKPYLDTINHVRSGFHGVYQKAAQDGTLRTDIPEEEIFSTTLHLMLAAVTRYAVGLVYIPESGFDPVNELTVLKEMLLTKYTIR